MSKKAYIKPEKGYAWNPLLTLPRNMACPCDSGKKFKFCHLQLLPLTIPEALAKEYKAAMKNADFLEQLKFVNDPIPDKKAAEE